MRTPKTLQSTQQATEIRPEISKLLKEEAISSPSKMESPKNEGEPSLHIWDFAGHELYYTTHQVILTIIVI